MGIFNRNAGSSKGLRYKLVIAFSLMSIIPIMACTYLISIYIFPNAKQLINISAVVVLSIVIAILGLLFARKLIDPVIDMALEAKIIASGEYSRNLAVSSDDEIGNLAQSINSMTQKIRTNLDELKGYGQRMREINVEIHKKVLALSSLLQIGDIISTGSIRLEAILELAVEEATQVFDSSFGMLYLPRGEEEDDYIPKFACNVHDEKLGELVLKKNGRTILEKAVFDHAIVVIDKGLKMSKEMDDFRSAYNFKSLLVIPIYSGKRNFGLLVVGNRNDDFKFKPDDIDLVKVFAKQITIAIESDILNRKTSELAIKDDLTDLYNRNFIMARLEEEIKRAIFYQRPCSFVVFNVDDFKKFRDSYGELAAEEALKRMAKLIKDNMIPVGKAARIGGDEFAMLLPEKNKRESFNVAEEIRKKIESTNLLREGKASLTVSVGVGENPIDGVTADEVFNKAIEAVNSAKNLGKNKVVA